jgi:uncharacterized protein with HEPN domain
MRSEALYLADIVEAADAIARFLDEVERNAIGLRNFVVHEYFGVSWDVVWTTATQDIPMLRNQIAAVLPGTSDSPIAAA